MNVGAWIAFLATMILSALIAVWFPPPGGLIVGAAGAIAGIALAIADHRDGTG